MEWIGKIFKHAAPITRPIKRALVVRVTRKEARERDVIFKRLAALPSITKNRIQW